MSSPSCLPHRPYRSRGRGMLRAAALAVLLGAAAVSACGGDGEPPAAPPTVLPPPADTIAPPPTAPPPEDPPADAAPTTAAGDAAEPTPDAPVSATATVPAPATVVAAATPTSAPTAPAPPTATPDPFVGGGGSNPADDGIAAVLEFSPPLGSATMRLVMPAPVRGDWPSKVFVRDVELLRSRDLVHGRMFIGPQVPIVLTGYEEGLKIDVEVIDPTGDGTNHRGMPGDPTADGGGLALRIRPPAALGTWTIRARQGDLRRVGTFELVSPDEPLLWIEPVAVRPPPDAYVDLFAAGYPADTDVPLHLYEVFDTGDPDGDGTVYGDSDNDVFMALYAGPIGSMATNHDGQARHRVRLPASVRPSCWLIQTEPAALASQPVFGPRQLMFHTWPDPGPPVHGFAPCRRMERDGDGGGGGGPDLGRDVAPVLDLMRSATPGVAPGLPGGTTP